MCAGLRTSIALFTLALFVVMVGTPGGARNKAALLALVIPLALVANTIGRGAAHRGARLGHCAAMDYYHDYSSYVFFASPWSPVPGKWRSSMPSLASGPRPAAIVGLLLIAAVGTTWVSTARQDKQDLLTERQPWQTDEPRPRFLTDTEGWLRSPRRAHRRDDARSEKRAEPGAIPFRMGNWAGRDADVTNQETLPTLGADNFLFRQYWRGNDVVWLTAIGGTKGQSFHAPTVCYVAANWNVEDLPPQQISVGNGQVAAQAIRATSTAATSSSTCTGICGPTCAASGDWARP